VQKNLVQTGFFHVLAARRIDHPQDLARFDRPMLDPITNLRSSGGLRLRQHDPQQRSDLCDADPHGRGGRGELLLAVFGNPHRLFSQRCILAGQTLVLLEDGLQVGMGFEQFQRPSQLGGILVGRLAAASCLVCPFCDASPSAVQNGRRITNPFEERQSTHSSLPPCVVGSKKQVQNSRPPIADNPDFVNRNPSAGGRFRMMPIFRLSLSEPEFG
jgi:hypothetical protein